MEQPSILVEDGLPPETSPFRSLYVKVESEGFTLYMRGDMKFLGDVAEIDRRDFRGKSFLLVRNALEE